MRAVQMQAVLRKLSKSVLLLAVLSVLGTTPALADSITVDENGNGFYTYSDGRAPTPLRVVGSPFGPQFLAYQVPFSVSDGTVVLAGPQEATSCPTLFGVPGCDVLTFSGIHTNALTFVSDPFDALDSSADSPNFPGPLLGPFAVTQETGPEGSNGAFYAPGQGDPGYALGADGKPLTYNFISDGLATVPEPGSLLLLGTGIIGILGLGKKK